MCIMGISGIAVVLSVIVLNVHDGGPRKEKVPIWLQYLAFRIIGPIVLWRGEILN
jgi:hypothetical protein